MSEPEHASITLELAGISIGAGERPAWERLAAALTRDADHLLGLASFDAPPAPVFDPRPAAGRR